VFGSLCEHDDDDDDDDDDGDDDNGVHIGDRVTGEEAAMLVNLIYFQRNNYSLFSNARGSFKSPQDSCCC